MSWMTLVLEGVKLVAALVGTFNKGEPKDRDELMDKLRASREQVRKVTRKR